jgi:hypothetical protein
MIVCNRLFVLFIQHKKKISKYFQFKFNNFKLQLKMRKISEDMGCYRYLYTYDKNNP